MLQQSTRWCLQNNLHQAEIMLPENSMLIWQYAKTTDTAKPEGFVSNIAENEQTARLSLQAAGYLNQPRGS